MPLRAITRALLGGLEKALLAVLLITLMMGMGSTLSLSHVREVLRQPRGVLVGVLSQFGWMPLAAFGLATLFELEAPLAVGLIVVGATPGGTTSNLFTYYARGDVALSIAMTSVSTLVAVVLMPLLLVVYTEPFTDAAFELPLANIVVTLVLVLAPVFVGMLIRKKREAWAPKIERLGSVSGVLVLVLLIVSSLAQNHELLFEIPTAGYAAAFLLGTIGMGLGFLAASLLGLTAPKRRAVAFETGIQNSPLAFAVILASFPEDAQDKMLWLPMLYALFVLLSASVITIAWRFSPLPVPPEGQSAKHE